MLLLDLETRSKCDIKVAGTYKYATDPTTEILVIGYSYYDPDSDEYLEDYVFNYDALPDEVRAYLEVGTGLIGAWNAQFDRLVWKHSNLIPAKAKPRDDRWYCCAAAARVNALPGSLNDAGRFLFKRYVKDIRGPQLIKLLSAPREDGTFLNDPVLMKEFGEYCLQDVIATRDVICNIRCMTQDEFSDYQTNEAINGRGIGVDLLLCELAEQYAAEEVEATGERLSALTGGQITKPTQSARIREFVLKHLPDALRKEAHRTSRGKMAGDDDRVRGAFLFAGATQTLRYASRGAQMHNFRRDCWTADETEDLITRMIEGDTLDQPMDTLAKCLRPAIVPADDNVLVVGDWSSIEARALPWLSYNDNAQHRLDVFADPTQDIYTVTAAELGLNDRQLGKVVELSMGYGGGVGALMNMAQVYQVTIPIKDRKPIVTNWRKANQWAEEFWDDLEWAAKMALREPGEVFWAGRVNYVFIPELIDGTLICTLPDGSTIQYPRCALEQGERGSVITSAKAGWSPAAGEAEWPRVTLWRGLLAENVTQAFCARLLAHALRRAEGELPVIGHTHDEIIAEVHHHAAPVAMEMLQEIMEFKHEWAEGLPLLAKPTIMRRYGK
jgi:DNA polymerase